MEQIIRRPVGLGESVKLSQLPTRYRTRMDSEGADRQITQKDFYIDEIGCKGCLSLYPYDVHSFLAYPARDLGKALDPTESRARWEYMNKTKRDLWYSFWLDFELEKEVLQDLREVTQKKEPLFGLLDIPVKNSSIQYYSVMSHTQIDIGEGRVALCGYTWGLLEEPPEARYHRWIKAAGKECEYLAKNLGEVLTIPNLSQVIDETKLKCITFGGRF
ncbi:MAG: hypothetical protein WCV81_04400 [Microgenomates group bacterium]|jgi:hypothetical protein